jgi:hypothetical protein
LVDKPPHSTAERDGEKKKTIEEGKKRRRRR